MIWINMFVVNIWQTCFYRSFWWTFGE